MNVNEIKDNLNVKQAVPFFMVANMEKSLDFYQNGLGFELKTKWEPRGTIEWCWLQLDNVAIMLQKYRNSLPPGARGLGVSIAFMCDDAISIYKNILARGLAPAEPFVGNGLWVVELKDPDGYAIFFESPTAVMEGTRFAHWNRDEKNR